MNNTLNIIEETIATSIPNDQAIKRHTRWIAKSAETPIVNVIWGAYINPHCHVLESYSMVGFNQLIKS